MNTELSLPDSSAESAMFIYGMKWNSNYGSQHFFRIRPSVIRWPILGVVHAFCWKFEITTVAGYVLALPWTEVRRAICYLNVTRISRLPLHQDPPSTHWCLLIQPYLRSPGSVVWHRDAWYMSFITIFHAVCANLFECSLGVMLRIWLFDDSFFRTACSPSPPSSMSCIALCV